MRMCVAAAVAVLVLIPGRQLAAQTSAASQQPVAAQQQSVIDAQQTAAAPQTSPQVATPAPRPSAPPPVGLNGQLADWLQIRGEFRGRLEGFTGGSFKPDNSDGYMLDRFRINATVAPGKMARFVVQVQDARVFDKTTGGQGNPFRDT